MNNIFDKKSQNERSVQRVEWLDAVKGILIILVVIGHNIQFGSGDEILNNHLYFENWIFKFIYSFHMPCLMMISGFFSGYSMKKPDYWKKKGVSLILPLIAWSSIPAGLSLLKSILISDVNAETIQRVITIFCVYYWFLWALLFCSFITWCVNSVFDEKSGIIISGMITLILMFLPDWLNVENWKYMYPFFAFGFYYNRKKLSIRKLQQYDIAIIIGLVVMFIALLRMYKTESYIYVSGMMVRSIKQIYIDFYRYCIGFVGSFMTILLVHKIFPFSGYLGKLLAMFGKMSLTIYMLDCLINSYILSKISKNYSFDYSLLFIETIIILAICVVMNYMIKRIPFANKLLLGSR